MCWKIIWCLLMAWSSVSNGLNCYNCSSTHHDKSRCGGDFVMQADQNFNSSRCYLVTCAGDNAMCFVRSWSSRAHHSWLVQRGCYQPLADDPITRSLNIPTRAMTCKHERFPEAEYKVCLCRADWCNPGTKVTPLLQTLLLLSIVNIISRILWL